MTRPVPLPIICACGWRGTLPTRAACPGCGGDHNKRLTPPRLAALQAFGRGEQPAIKPNMRNWLRQWKLIEAIGPAPAPTGRRAERYQRQPFGLTALGEAVSATHEQWQMAGVAQREAMTSSERGLYSKYTVTRTDGSSAPGRKHCECAYFVLDLEHDPFAIPALKAYAKECRKTHPDLAADLDVIVENSPAPPCSCREAFCPHGPRMLDGHSAMAQHIMRRGDR